MRPYGRYSVPADILCDYTEAWTIRYPTKIGVVVVLVHTLGADVPLGTLNSIIKKASLK